MIPIQTDISRAAGILLHPTSLPGPYGIGDLGPSAYRWVNMLAQAGQTLWQILPLGPTGYGDSPYQCFSAFAGNPYLISPDILIDDGLIERADVYHLVSGMNFPSDRVEFGRAITFKIALLAKAWRRFQTGYAAELKSEFENFCHTQAGWLDDYALFMALKDVHGGVSWLQWDTPLRARAEAPLAAARITNFNRIGLHKFQQFLFFRQWQAVKKYANRKGIRLIGDVPLFVSSDSADVWAHPELFQLDADRNPSVVAGVPPDYFSPTGQLWGNPIYDWAALQRTDYAWWIERLRTTLAQVDLIRLDHFRGFESYWEIPAGMPTAEIGRWLNGPQDDLLNALTAAFGKQISMIAEDLGIITPEVDALRERFNLPGMRVLQFAFSDPNNRFLPHNYDTGNTVVYTGTHDNDTTRGWYSATPESERDFARRYLARDGHDIAWDMIRLAWASTANYAIAPLQDVLDLGSEARMNTPGTAAGNWSWRFQDGQLTDLALCRLGELTKMYSRSAR